jgi:endonuclease III
MLRHDAQQEIEKVANYVKLVQPSFYPYRKRLPYNHMGATITDAILQAGLNYKSVVYPRVYELFSKYSLYTSTTDFIILFQTIPLIDLINWKNSDKPVRIENLTWFLFNEKVESEKDFSEWIMLTTNMEKLSQINGIGPKTIDYLKMLVGIPSIPIDRHLFKFLERAGVKTEKYDHARYLYDEVSQALNINKEELDFNIWNLMSSRKGSKNAEYEQYSLI